MDLTQITVFHLHPEHLGWSRGHRCLPKRPDGSTGALFSLQPNDRAGVINSERVVGRGTNRLPALEGVPITEAAITDALETGFGFFDLKVPPELLLSSSSSLVLRGSDGNGGDPPPAAAAHTVVTGMVVVAAAAAA
jgi:hypothetical protein